MSNSEGAEHFFLTNIASSRAYSATGRGRPAIRSVDASKHGPYLQRSFEEATRSIQQKKEVISASEAVQDIDSGYTLLVEGFSSEYPLKLESLQRKNVGKNATGNKWEVLRVQNDESGKPIKAAVWISEEAGEKEFHKLVEAYISSSSNSEQNNPRNAALLANISRFSPVSVSDLWSSNFPVPKGYENEWWEVWFAKQPFEEIEVILRTFFGDDSFKHSLSINDSHIYLIKSKFSNLEPILVSPVKIFEIRKPSFINSIEDLEFDEQIEYVEEMAERLEVQSSEELENPNNPVICHLDTGINRGHMLISPFLPRKSHLTIYGNNPGDVLRSHGTSMAGIALYGDSLENLFTSIEPVRVEYSLESVRVFIDESSSLEKAQQLTSAAAITSAVTTIEVSSDKEHRVFCVPVSRKSDGKPGEPTLWSSTMDALAYGADITSDETGLTILSDPENAIPRMLVLCTGNVDSYLNDYVQNSENSPVEDPGQSWNCLTVGAFTNKTEKSNHPQYKDWDVLAESGDISPHTRTSTGFEERQWPIKPEVTLEGGNVLYDPRKSGLFEDIHPNLSLLSLGSDNDSHITRANATSAATALASRLTALISKKYPSYWSETIRGLIVHRAKWTKIMSRSIEGVQGKPRDEAEMLLRRFGWGVPEEKWVLESISNSATIVIQDEFIPFRGNEFKMDNFRLHELPWPQHFLASLGDLEITMRVTLSYYIEPYPHRKGWGDKYMYPSHRLRFDLREPSETAEDFTDRISKSSKQEENNEPETPANFSREIRWLLGSQRRSYGSLHQDEWTGKASQLASCSEIAVYPASGWWKRGKNSRRQNVPVRYALIVSLSTPDEVDVYTAIKNSIAVTTEVEEPVEVSISV